MTIAEYLSKYNVFTVKRVLSIIEANPDNNVYTENPFYGLQTISKEATIANIACTLLTATYSVHTIVFTLNISDVKRHQTSPQIIILPADPELELTLAKTLKQLNFTVIDSLSSMRVTRQGTADDNQRYQVTSSA